MGMACSRQGCQATCQVWVGRWRPRGGARGTVSPWHTRPSRGEEAAADAGRWECVTCAAPRWTPGAEPRAWHGAKARPLVSELVGRSTWPAMWVPELGQRGYFTDTCGLPVGSQPQPVPACHAHTGAITRARGPLRTGRVPPLLVNGAERCPRGGWRGHRERGCACVWQRGRGGGCCQEPGCCARPRSRPACCRAFGVPAPLRKRPLLIQVPGARCCRKKSPVAKLECVHFHTHVGSNQTCVSAAVWLSVKGFS